MTEELPEHDLPTGAMSSAATSETKEPLDAVRHGADAGRVGMDPASMDSDAAAIDEEALRSDSGMGAEAIGAPHTASNGAAVNGQRLTAAWP